MTDNVLEKFRKYTEKWTISINDELGIHHVVKPDTVSPTDASQATSEDGWDYRVVASNTSNPKAPLHCVIWEPGARGEGLSYLSFLENEVHDLLDNPENHRHLYIVRYLMKYHQQRMDALT